MESIFDMDPNPAELAELLGQAIEKSDYLTFPVSPDTELGRLYRLCMLRGDEAAAGKFLARIEDAEYRYNVALIDTH